MSKNNYYNSIDDLLLYNWRHCLKGDIVYVRLDLSKGNEKDDILYWEKIYDSYLKEFGLGKDYEYYLELKLELAQKQCEFVLTGVRFLLNRIEVLEVLIHELMTRNTGGDLDTLIIYVSKWMGQIINDKTITTKMFLKMVEEYNKANKPSTIKKSA